MTFYKAPVEPPGELPSEASELRSSVSSRARSSFVFFVRGVLGLRKLSADRLTQVESGAAASPVEQKLLAQWFALRGGQAVDLPPAARFLCGVAA